MPCRGGVRAATVRVSVRGQMLLAHRTGDRRGHGKRWRGHGRGRLDSLELEEKHLDQLSFRR